VVLRIKKPYPNQPGFAIAKATALRGVNPDKLVALFVVSLNFACSYNECHHKLLCFFSKFEECHEQIQVVEGILKRKVSTHYQG
jgi:hypothetical protein